MAQGRIHDFLGGFHKRNLKKRIKICCFIFIMFLQQTFQGSQEVQAPNPPLNTVLPVEGTMSKEPMVIKTNNVS